MSPLPTAPFASNSATKLPDEQLFLQTMYTEQCEQARQHEELRQQSTTLVFALSSTIAAAAGAILALTIGHQATPDHADSAGWHWILALCALLGVFVVVLSWFGQKLSLKHYERNRMHTERARAYRQELEKIFGNVKYDQLRKEAKRTHEINWNKEEARFDTQVLKGRTYLYWINLYIFLIGLGVIMTVVPLLLEFIKL